MLIFIDMDVESKFKIIINLLNENYGYVKSFLNYTNSFELLIGVILSAQTTDKQVNAISPELFDKYPGTEDLASADITNVEKIIKSTGFYHIKAKNIINAAKTIIEQFNGIIPNNINDLIKIPGVGRKSANVIVGAIYKKPAIIVDTHFKRVVKRLGFTNNDNPDKIELDLKKIIEPKNQYNFSMKINNHGRLICHSRKPDCEKCFLSKYCDYYKTQGAVSPTLGKASP